MNEASTRRMVAYHPAPLPSTTSLADEVEDVPELPDYAADGSEDVTSDPE